VGARKTKQIDEMRLDEFDKASAAMDGFDTVRIVQRRSATPERSINTND
jgi:hypothetical protein